jgi:hypothetical protein
LTSELWNTPYLPPSFTFCAGTCMFCSWPCSWGSKIIVPLRQGYYCGFVHWHLQCCHL